jgi:hypothetical protein
MMTQDVDLVHAYGGAHFSISYEDAVDTVDWFAATDVAHGKVGLARVSEDAFELVAMGDDADGGMIGVDSDYVTLDVGRRLAREGRVVVMVRRGLTEHDTLWG